MIDAIIYLLGLALIGMLLVPVLMAALACVGFFPAIQVSIRGRVLVFAPNQRDAGVEAVFGVEFALAGISNSPVRRKSAGSVFSGTIRGSLAAAAVSVVVAGSPMGNLVLPHAINDVVSITAK